MLVAPRAILQFDPFFRPIVRSFCRIDKILLALMIEKSQGLLVRQFGPTKNKAPEGRVGTADTPV